MSEHWGENSALEKRFTMKCQGNKSKNNRGEELIQLRKENILRKREQVTEPNTSEKSNQCGQSLIFVLYVNSFLGLEKKKHFSF